jgi:hypothetical protein
MCSIGSTYYTKDQNSDPQRLIVQASQVLLRLETRLAEEEAFSQLNP